MTHLQIALVEDDADQRKLTAELIQRDLPECGMLEIDSEEQFQSELGRGDLRGCYAVVIDVMLPWTNLEALVPVPANYEGYYEAGLRCIRELRQREWGRMVPVIIYTLLEPQDIAEHIKKLDGVVYVSKSQPRRLLMQLRKFAYHSEGGAPN